MESFCHKHNIPVRGLTLWKQYLSWAGRLHGIGLNTSHIGYHEHSAYILENADMPDFSRKEQFVLAQLVLGHHSKVRKVTEIVGSNEMMRYIILSLRFAALFCRVRMLLEPPPLAQLRPDSTGKGFMLRISRNWLEQHPLVGDAFAYESTRWQKIDMPFGAQLQ